MWLLFQFLQEQQRARKLSVHPQLEKPVFDSSEEISKDPLIGGVRRRDPWTIAERYASRCARATPSSSG
jgi:hypothetical protein